MPSPRRLAGLACSLTTGLLLATDVAARDLAAVGVELGAVAPGP